MVESVAERPVQATSGKGSTSLSGLTEQEAREFHKMFIVSFLGFVAIAAVAHFLVWQWRPWIPGVAGYEVSMLVDAVRTHVDV